MAYKKSFNDLLCCPKCKGDLDFSRSVCSQCNGAFYFEEGKFSLSLDHVQIGKREFFDGLKEKFRRFSPLLYRFLLAALAPVYSQFSVKKYIGKFNDKAKILNLGAGVSFFAPHVVNVDWQSYEGVDIVAPLESLPVRSNSVDAIINISVLEHIREPQQVISEFHRILKPGGEVICFVPFLQGFHAAPFDFHRYTREGLRELFKGFQIQKIIAIGPTSALLWTLQEWIALLLSFFSVRIYRGVYLLTLLLSPLKYFDFLLARHPMATQIASGHFIIVNKK